MTTVRVATADDRTAVVELVVAAFRDDVAWAFMHEDQYDRLGALLAESLFDLRVDAGTVWVVDDPAEGLLAVSMWESPGDSTLLSSAAERSEVWDRYRRVGGERAWQRLGAYDRAVEAVIPPEPFWYLGVVATSPDRQGQGLARRVTAPALALADAAGLPACLETSNPANKPVYARLGFFPTADIVIADGPPTWWLTRSPLQ